MKFKLTEETTVLIAVSVAAMLVLATVVYVAFLPKPEETFMDIYVLDSNHMAIDYPQNLNVGETIQLDIGVRNYMGQAEYAAVYVKLANASYSVEPCPLSPLVKFQHILSKKETWEFRIYVRIEEAKSEGSYRTITQLKINNKLYSVNIPAKDGKNFRLIFELWLYNATSKKFEFSRSWVQIWFNES